MSFEEEQEANQHRFDKDGDNIFEKTYLLNDLKISPIANYEVDEFTRIGITEIFGHYFVYITLNDMSFEAFMDLGEAEESAQKLVAEMMSQHIEGVDD